MRTKLDLGKSVSGLVSYTINKSVNGPVDDMSFCLLERSIMKIVYNSGQEIIENITLWEIKL